MSIGVHCDECGKTYQVRDDMAGRRGKCPRGHAIKVPLPESNVETEDEGSLVFTTAERPEPARAAHRSARPATEPEPVLADDNDFSAFPTQVAGSSVRDEETPAPRTGRHRKPERKPAGKEGKPSLMPLILGGILAVLGIGGGATLLIVSRGDIGPLKAQAEESNKKAAAAEEKAQKAESLKLVAEAELERVKKSPSKDPALTEAQKQLKAAEKRATDAERKLSELTKGPRGVGGDAAIPKEMEDPSAPGGKDDPVMPGGKLGPDRPAKGKPLAKGEMEAPDPNAGRGKNWTAEPTVTFGQFNFMAGDKLKLTPQEDAVLKAAGGKVTVKFRWQLAKGKEMPARTTATLLVVDGGTIRLAPAAVTLSGDQGDSEATFDVSMVKATGQVGVYFFISEGELRKPTIHSTILGLQAEFPLPKK